MRRFGSSDPTDLAPFGEEEDDESVRLKKYVGWWEAGHNENECRDFVTGPEKKCVVNTELANGLVRKRTTEANVHSRTFWRKRDMCVEARCGAECLPSPRGRQ